MRYPTLSDLNSESLIPPLGARKAPDIGPAALLVSTGKDFSEIRSLLAQGESRPFFISTLLKVPSSGKGFCCSGPFIGSPYGVMLLESLIAKGAQQVVVLGWCGAVSETLRTGDLVVVKDALSDEGTSRSYLGDTDDFPVVRPSESLSAALQYALSEADVDFKKERIWTTDAIYRETETRVAFFRDRGAKAVDMECSALFAAARYRGAEIAALMVVSDEVSSDRWEPGFRSDAFKRARKTACHSLVRFVRRLDRDG